jgi:drug/metabolite transporter (DMT)-like permease
VSERLITTESGSSAGAFEARDWGLLAATALIWGSAYLLIEIGLEGLEPTAIAFARVALGAAALAAVPAARRARIGGRDRARVALLGVLWLAVPLTLFPIAQQWVSSVVAGMITGAQPLLAAAIAAVLLRRLPGRRQALGLALGFAGVAAIVLSSAADEGSSEVLGVGLILIAVACYALSTNVAVPLQRRHGALAVILRALAVAVCVLAVPGVIGLAASSPDAGSLAAMLPLGLLCTGLGYVTFTALVGRVGATRGAVAIYFVPVVAIALGATVRGETVGIAAIAGTAAVLGGGWLTSRPARLGDA